MIQIKSFAFNPFQENTYVLYDDLTKECIIVDPGNSNHSEDQEICAFIERMQLKPVRLINTHCHIDHVLGNQLIAKQYNLQLEGHKLEVPVLSMCRQVGTLYGIPYRESPELQVFHEEGDTLTFGTSEIGILFTPGHSPGSICLYLRNENSIIGGDVLFRGSIGRTDLPGGDYDTLISSIKKKLLGLPPETVVYPGHGPSTTIGAEKRMNPFLQ